jgi:hypothetical protein
VKVLDQTLLAGYLQNDWVLQQLSQTTEAGDEQCASQKWLVAFPPKRLMYDLVYGDLHRSAERLKILDIGGGFSGLSRKLLAMHDYTLLEFNAHDSADYLRKVERDLGKRFWIDGDWIDFDNGGAPYDVVIANDLFPNVDQRLALFLERLAPIAGEIRLSLTFYNKPRYYLTRRIEGDEVLCVLAWDGAMTARALEPYRDYLDNYVPSIFGTTESIFQNGRQVCVGRIKGFVEKRNKAIVSGMLNEVENGQC